MSQNIAPPIPSLVPETAPFSPEQRAWLNGFFAGLVSLDGAGVTALSPEQSAALMPGGANEFGDADDGSAPWHDQALPLPERMQLADGKPLRRIDVPARPLQLVIGGADRHTLFILTHHALYSAPIG